MGARKQGIPKTLPLVTETISPTLNSCYWLSHCYYVVLVRMFKQTEECFDKSTELLCLHFLENHKANKCLTNCFKILLEGERYISLQGYVSFPKVFHVSYSASEVMNMTIICQSEITVCTVETCVSLR